MKINRAFIKGINWALAGLLSLLGFTGCTVVDPRLEYGVPNADFTVKGTVVDKATGKPIKGIRVGYDSAFLLTAMYGTIPTPYQPKASVTTDSNGAFNLTDHFNLGELGYYQLDESNNPTLTVYVEDIDSEQNGLYQSDTLQVNFSNATQTKKASHWYEGAFTVTENVKLDEIKNQ